MERFGSSLLTWAEQFYFVSQAREVALMVLLCPYAIYVMFMGFIDNKKSKIRDAIIQTSSGNENLPVAIIGRYKVSEKFRANFMQGEVIGNSFFEFGWDRGETPKRALKFMQYLGIYFNLPNGEQKKKAINEAVYMPSYPNQGFVKKLPDVIVVKLS
ncbi:hypothetical protein R83H12_01283 [Fibrobacteria bacterium R8-3-H12]